MSVPCRDRKGHTVTQTKCHVKTQEAEFGVTLPQAKEHLELPELEEVRRDPFLELSEGAWP